MDRRAAVRLLSAAAATASIPGELAALGRDLHERLGTGVGGGVLTPEQDATVVALTELILPATDTPGAKAARVNEFIDLLLAEWVDASERERFTAGLAMIDQRARDAFGTTFVALTPAQQATLLTTLDGEAARWKVARKPDEPEPFFRSLKWLTLFGYFTSKVGAEQEDHYQIVPGRYDPCAPLHPTRPE